MKADPAEQERLLELQEHDSALDRVVQRRKNLPELAELAGLEDQLSHLRDSLALARAGVDDIARDQQKLENEVDLVRSRAARDQKRLDAGQVSTARELESLQSEIGSLGRRQSALEDDLLEVMERLEEIDRTVSELEVRRQQLEADREAATARRDVAFEELEQTAATARAARDAVAATLSAELLALYDRIRASSGGVGAAGLVRRRCSGCHLELSGTDLRAAAAAAPDEILRCEECRRILVRTPDSGL